MKYLIIFAHPNQDSLNANLKLATVEYLEHNRHEVKVRDLYAINFNPILSFDDLKNQGKGIVSDDVAQEQELIVWADSIVFIYPIWWAGLPAIMKGYIDRVFSYGFAYKYDQGVQKGLLSGKQTIVINTLGKSLLEYNAIGMDKALSLISDTGIYKYCGLKISKHLYLYEAHKTSSETIENWKKQISEALANIS